MITSIIHFSMNFETILTFSAVAAISIASPGPAALLAMRNAMNFGMRAVLWSSLGNVCGIFCLSGAAMLGLGALLKSSTLLFAIVKVLGAVYLFYVGIHHLLGRSSAVNSAVALSPGTSGFTPSRVWSEAFLLAATNPKPILFFTALFPQFIREHEALLPQFLVLTAIFMALSLCTLICYALVATRVKVFLLKPKISKWLDRVVGMVFVSFGAALLALRRPVA